MKTFLQLARSNSLIASVLYSASRPIFVIARTIQKQIGRHIRRNGGKAIYDGVTLKFPTKVGEGFLAAISWYGTDGHEPDTWRVLRALIERSGTFIDIGSNIGLYSVLAKKIAEKADVLSFEPIPNLIDQSRQFHAANNVQASVHQMALGDSDGHATLYQPIESHQEETSASTLAFHSWQARKNHREFRVKTSRLDTFLSDTELRRPVTIKIDVEDYEAAVLRGAKETISRYQPWIVCEILPRPKRPSSRIGNQHIPQEEQHGNSETVAMINAIGYSAFAITASGLFRFSEFDFAINRSFTDFLLLPKKHIPDDRNYFSQVQEFGLIS